MTASGLQQLIEESAELERVGGRIQGERELLVDEDDVDAFINRFHDWYARALDLLPADLEERFRGEYKGGLFSPKIKAFLAAPGEPSIIQPDEPNPLLSYWQYPFDAAVRGPLLTQRPDPRRGQTAP